MPAGAAARLLVPCAPVALWAAWSDLCAMRIPNAAVVALLAVFAVAGLAVFPVESWAWRWLHLAPVLAIGAGLTAAGLVGAGDAKLAAAMAPFVAAGDLAPVCYLFAATLLAAFTTHRAVRRIAALRGLAPHWRSWERRDFPMGLALAGTLLLYLFLAATRGS